MSVFLRMAYEAINNVLAILQTPAVKKLRILSRIKIKEIPCRIILRRLLSSRSLSCSGCRNRSSRWESLWEFS